MANDNVNNHNKQWSEKKVFLFLAIFPYDDDVIAIGCMGEGI